MTAPELVIFDCDGVLIDSECLSAETLVAQLRRIGISSDVQFVFDKCLGRNFATAAAEIEALTGRALPAGFEADYRTALLNRFAVDLRPMAGVGAVLDALAARAILTCVATSSAGARAAGSLSLCGFDQRFAGRVFTGSMVTRAKPAPDLFLLAAHTLKVKPERCLVIEDSDTGVMAAQAAGMIAWRFCGGRHFRQGYGPGVAAAREFSDMGRFFEGFADE